MVGRLPRGRWLKCSARAWCPVRGGMLSSGGAVLAVSAVRATAMLFID
jgi:hypothetical protein